MSNWVNCNADYRFQVDVTTPNGSGDLATPAAGVVTGLVVRLSDSNDGAAINSAVDNLPAQETADRAGRFFYDCDTLFLQTYVLPLGTGKPFWAIWSKAGDLDLYVHRYRITDHTRI